MKVAQILTIFIDEPDSQNRSFAWLHTYFKKAKLQQNDHPPTALYLCIKGLSGHSVCDAISYFDL